MKEFVKFLCDNYHMLIVLVIELVTLIVLICKKKVKIQDTFQSVLLVLPDLISLAEKKFDKGSEKYSYVFNRCIEMLMSLTHQSSDKVIETYASDLNAAIENILATPQKKER